MEASPNPTPSTPKVFISFSHDCEEHQKRVRGLHASLARDGCDGQLDFHKDTDEDWPLWMTRKLKAADFILCVITETYAQRFDDQELPDVGLGVGWEAGLIRRLLYKKKLHNDRIFPVVFADQDRQHIPLELEGYDHFLLAVPSGYEALLRKILKQPQHLRPAVGTAPHLGTATTPPLFPRPGGSSSPAATTTTADISRILKYAPAELIGREHELNLLTAAWKGDPQALAAYPLVSIKHRPRVLTFVALGGEGKTSLVAKWAAEFAAQDWPGCDAVFAWSFYSQGTRDQVAASSDLFLKEALLFFSDNADQEFAASSASAFEKGQRLARMLGQRRCLLILDGLEPLQYAPASTAHAPGGLKDQGIRALLRSLATNSQGLCIVTTRYSLPDVKAFWQTTVAEVPLLRLSREAGVHLLKTFNVKGTQKEFEALVEDVKGHALTLTLFGGFLKRAFHGDIRQRDRVKFEKADAQMDGGHAFRTMAAYEQWLLLDGGDEGRREVAILRLMGLFDRPADASCLRALRSETIPGLTEPLIGLVDDDWEFCLSGLEAAKLLTVNRDMIGALVSLDAHPHLREYFAGRLRREQPDAWRAAHRRLYEHLCTSAPRCTRSDETDTMTVEAHPTLEELQPLYQAVSHGCRAGMQQATYVEVLRKRIFRNNPITAYSWTMLGAAGTDLTALASFFDCPFESISQSLDVASKGEILGLAGYLFYLGGRLKEGLDLLKMAAQHEIGHGRRLPAARATAAARSCELLRGDITCSIENAPEAEQWANLCTEPEGLYWQMRYLGSLGEACHQAGDFKTANRHFLALAERRVKCDEPLGHPALLGFFQHCDFLLNPLELAVWRRLLGCNQQEESTLFVYREKVPKIISLAKEGRTRANEIKQRALEGLCCLILFRIQLYEAILFPASATKADLFAVVGSMRNESDDLNSLCRASTVNSTVLLVLLTRALMQSLVGELTGPESAQSSLDEAWEIAERGPMKLRMVDIHLHRARLFFREEKYPEQWGSPEQDLKAARKLIESCGYGRRLEELQDAEAAILGKP